MLWSFSQKFRQYLSHIRCLSYSTYLLCNNYMQVTLLGVKDSSQTKSLPLEHILALMLGRM